jgi:hypothetical protein
MLRWPSNNEMALTQEEIDYMNDVVQGKEPAP